MSLEADPLSQTSGPLLPGVKGDALTPQGRDMGGFFKPALPTNKTKSTELTIPTKLTVHPSSARSSPTSPALPTSPTRSTNTHDPPKPHIGLSTTPLPLIKQRVNHEITRTESAAYTSISNDDPNEDIDEHTTLIMPGNKTLVLNSVLAFVNHTLGPINSKIIANQLSEFYSREKLVKAYTVGSLLLPNQRLLRQKPDPLAWKNSVLCQHIINIIILLREENIWFASLHLDVPMVPLYDITKSPDSRNSFWDFIIKKKKQPIFDKYCQCNIISDTLQMIQQPQKLNNSENTDQINENVWPEDKNATNQAINVVTKVSDNGNDHCKILSKNVSKNVSTTTANSVGQQTDTSTIGKCLVNGVSTFPTSIIDNKELTQSGMTDNMSMVEDKEIQTAGLYTSTPILTPYNRLNGVTDSPSVMKELLVTNKQILNNNQDMLEAILSIHKTVLRRIPKKQKKIIKKNKTKTVNTVSRNLSSFMNEIDTVATDQIADISIVSIPELPNASTLPTNIIDNKDLTKSGMTDIVSTTEDKEIQTAGLPKLTNKPVDISNLTQKVVNCIPFSFPTPIINQSTFTDSKIGIPKQIQQNIDNAQTTIVWSTNQNPLPAPISTNPPKQTLKQVPSLLSIILSYCIKASTLNQKPKIGSNQTDPNLPAAFSYNTIVPGQTPSLTDKIIPTSYQAPNIGSNQTILGQVPYQINPNLPAAFSYNPIVPGQTPSLTDQIIPTNQHLPASTLMAPPASIGLPRVQKASILKQNQNSFDSHTIQQGFKYNENIKGPSIRGSRRPSFSRQSSPKRYSRKRTDSMHSTDSRQHMDYQSSSRPHSRQTSPKRPVLNPQRNWDRDTTVYPNLHFQNQNQNHLNYPNNNHISYYHQNQERKHEQYNQQKPNHVHETSKRVTTFGPDGTSYQMMATSIEHDGEQVYTKSSEEIKQDRLNQLRDNGVEGKLAGTQKPNQLRLFITRVAPNTTCTEMEAFFLDEFPQVIRVFVRKLPMFKNKYYASFVITVLSNPDNILDIEEFQSHDYPDDIKVFPGREPGEQQYV